MKGWMFSRAVVAGAAERRAITLLGITFGLLVGCGVLGLLGIGLIVYFAAWCADLLGRFGETWRQGGMLVGFVFGFGLWAASWSVAGALVAIGLASIGKPGRKANRAA